MMRPIVLAAAALCALAPRAHASLEGRYRLFDVDDRGIDKKVRAAIAAVEATCTYSLYSRVGPRPSEVARCNRAEADAVALGPDAARMALVRIDQGTGPGAMNRLYDVVARVGDLRLVDTLIRGLEENERHGLAGIRRYETPLIVRVLSTLTYAELNGTPAIQWRAFWDAHHDKTRAQLFALRLAEARVQVAADDVEVATSGARFLAEQPLTRTESRRALEALLRREGLTELQRAHIQDILRRIPTGPAQLADGTPAT